MYTRLNYVLTTFYIRFIFVLNLERLRPGKLVVTAIETIFYWSSEKKDDCYYQPGLISIQEESLLY